MPQKWEYRTIDLNEQPRSSDQVDLLNNAGDAGWELVTITQIGIAYLRRQIDAPRKTSSRARRRNPPGIE